jgi:hypothetical protein
MRRAKRTSAEVQAEKKRQEELMIERNKLNQRQVEILAQMEMSLEMGDLENERAVIKSTKDVEFERLETLSIDDGRSIWGGDIDANGINVDNILDGSPGLEASRKEGVRDFFFNPL